MDSELVSPNLHVILVHYPIAMLVAGTLIELFSFMWRRHGFRAAGRWMILIVALMTVPTTFSGMFARWDVANPQHQDWTWKETANAGLLSAAQWSALRTHLILQVSASFAALLVCVTWLGCSNRWRANLHVPLLLILLGSVGATAAGAWYGGETVYHHGTAVAAVKDEPVVDKAKKVIQQDRVKAFFPPLQLHVISAGTTVALGLVAMGLALRNLSEPPLQTQMDQIAAALTRGGAIEDDETTNLPPAVAPDPNPLSGPAPASRFWMLTSLLALMTIAGGTWVLINSSGTKVPRELWSNVQSAPRRLAHVIAGGSLFVLPLLLALLARFAPRGKFAFMLFGLLIVGAIGFQIWIGTLLLFDGPIGTVRAFQP